MDFPFLNLDLATDENRGFNLNSKTMSNCVGPDKTACFDPSHLDLHCLHRY